MTETQVNSRGNMLGFLNTGKEPGDDRPVFQGKLSLPDQSNQRVFALWASTSEKTGATVLTGRASIDPNAQIEKLTNPAHEHDADSAIEIAQRDGGPGLKLDPHALLMFKNKQKDEANPNRPDYWGYFNPGGGEALVRVAAWSKTDRRGNAMITGSLQRDEREAAADVAPSPAAIQPKKLSRAKQEDRAR